MKVSYQLKRTLQRAATWTGVATLAAATLLPNAASAAQITARKVTLSTSSAAAASATTSYTFNFTVPSATVIKSFDALACTTALGACTPPPGFANASSTFGSQTNLSTAGGTWTINTATSGDIRIVNAAATGAPTGSQTVVINNLQNPTTTNQTFWLRMTTYSDSAWATPVDTGTVAASTDNQVVVTADVSESLTFCVYTLANCAAGGGAVTLAPDPMTTAAPSFNTSKMDAATNGSGGYVITYADSGQLTSGANLIPASTPNQTGTASTPASEQFMLNLATNTTPSVGAAAVGSGTGTASANYNTANSYSFNTAGATVATAAGPTLSNTYTVSYVANVAATTKPGAYTSTFTYVCTATF